MEFNPDIFLTAQKADSVISSTSYNPDRWTADQIKDWKNEIIRFIEILPEFSILPEIAEKYAGKINVFFSRLKDNYVLIEKWNSLDTANESIFTKYEGGSYADLRNKGHGWNSQPSEEVHHMPSKGSSVIPESDGPSISMDYNDHRQTASCGYSKEAREYQAKQKEYIDKGDYKKAMQMDIDDIHEKFDTKYDKAIEDAKKYSNELRNSDYADKCKTGRHQIASRCIAKTANMAGLECVKFAAPLTCALSIIFNLVDVIEGEKTPKEAAISVVKDTGKGSVLAYTTAFSEATIRGILKKSSNVIIQGVAKSNIVTFVVFDVIELLPSVKDYCTGKISGEEFAGQVVEKSIKVAGSTVGMALGQALIPVPVLGAVIGAAVGYLATAVVYEEAKKIIENPAEYCAEKKEQIENVLAEAKQIMAVCKNKMAEYKETVIAEIKDVKDSVSQDIIIAFDKIDEKLGLTEKKDNIYEASKEFIEKSFNRIENLRHNIPEHLETNSKSAIC